MPKPRCKLPPEGWMCTRGEPHSGPCAAWPIDPSVDDKLITMAETIVMGIYNTEQRRDAYDRALRNLRAVAMGDI